MENMADFIGSGALLYGNTMNITVINRNVMNTVMNSDTMNGSTLNSTESSEVLLSVGAPCGSTVTNGQLPVVFANGSIFPLMPDELSKNQVSPVACPASGLGLVTPSSVLSTPLGSAGKSAGVARSTPLKPPKKYRGPGEDRAIQRCKRSLSFARETGETPVESSEAPEVTEKTTRPRASVERRNKRERLRVKQINNTFVTLRNQLPSAGLSPKRNAKKFSKVDTLRMAIDYIEALQQLILDHDAMFTSAECLALLASPPLGGHEASPYHNTPGSMLGVDSGSECSGAESFGSSSADLHQMRPTSYPLSSSSSSSYSGSTGVTDFYPPLESNLSHDLLDAFLADIYMAS